MTREVAEVKPFAVAALPYHSGRRLVRRAGFGSIANFGVCLLALIGFGSVLLLAAV